MSVSIPDCFMIAFACGLVFGPVYEALRIVRLILRLRAAVFLCDLVFFILAAMFICKLSEFLGSYVRLYTVLGFGTGIFTYIVTVGRIFNVLESAASVAWRRTIGRALRFLWRSARNSAGKIRHKAREVFVKIHEYSENLQKRRLNSLHLNQEMVYNSVGKFFLKDQRIQETQEKQKNGEGEKAHVIQAKIRKSP